jgi:hypothetical protein
MPLPRGMTNNTFSGKSSHSEHFYIYWNKGGVAGHTSLNAVFAKNDHRDLVTPTTQQGGANYPLEFQFHCECRRSFALFFLKR